MMQRDAGSRGGVAFDGSIPEQWPLVGRLDELYRALDLLEAAGSAGVAIHGPSGVGRSRFASELLALAVEGGRRSLRAVATSSSTAVSYGAFAHFFPDELVFPDDGGATIDPVRFLAQARNSVTGAGPVVLLVDDAHLLDALSLTLLQQLSGDPSVRIIVTVRSGEIEPDGLSVMWRSERIGRVDLAPLDLEAVNALLHVALGGPVDGRAALVLFVTSGGSPLLLREIVRTARDQGTLALVDDVWRVRGPLPSARRAVELASDRLSSLDAESRHLLELLVLVGRTPIELIDGVASAATVERLEAGGLIRVHAGEATGVGHTVTISRHALADAVRTEISPLRSRNILRAHAYAYERWSPGRPEDELRVAGWRLDAGIPAEPSELERMATLARKAEDFEGAIRFSEAAQHAGGTLRSAALWTDSLYELCRWEECEAVIAATINTAGSVHDRLRLVAIRGSNLLFGLMRGQDGLDVLHTALEEFDAGHPKWQVGLDAAALANVRNELVTRVALLQMYGGDPLAAIATLGPAPPAVPEGNDDDLTVRQALYARVLWALPSVPAIALSGRTGEAVALGLEALSEHLRLGGEVGSASIGTHLVTLGLALQEHGDFEQARSFCMLGYDTTVESGQLIGQIWLGANLARIGMVTGHPQTVLRWGREVLAATSAAGWLGLRQMTLHGMVIAHAQVGDLPAARRCLMEAEAIGGDFGFLFPERAIGGAYVAAADGRYDEARGELLMAAGRAAETGHLTIESWLRFEATRLGSVTEVGRLHELAEQSDSAIVHVRAAYAAAMIADDPKLLEAVGVTLETLECDLAASEMFALAAEALRATGLTRSASAMNLRAAAALARSEGARSFRVTRLDVVVPLTSREREIAGLAASGVASKEIAMRLDVSVRTVSNHLQNAYTKLGVSSRVDVAAALGITL